MLRRALLGSLAAALFLGASAFAPNGTATGDQQSPVVIEHAIAAKIQPLNIRYPEGLADFLVYNDGHTIKVQPVRPQYTTVYDGKSYSLDQFHFHHMAEHVVAGAPVAPMELHFVNTNPDGTAVVLGVFLDSDGTNAAFSTIMRAAPPNGSKNKVPVRIDPTQLLPKDRHYWMYMGSLTTSKYDQVVRWIVLQTHVPVDQASISRFAELYPNNARGVQPINRRFILSGP
jgi:carbonic anhydrase